MLHTFSDHIKINIVLRSKLFFFLWASSILFGNITFVINKGTAKSRKHYSINFRPSNTNMYSCSQIDSIRTYVHCPY